MKKVISFCDRYSLLPSGGLVLAAVSGGKDSMCLLDILYKLKDRYGYELCAIHFNHMIRGKSADRDENFVMETCRNRKIKFIAGRGDTLRYAKEHKIGTEEAGRILRYRFFEETARETGAVCVATAHNADDNAETVLMNMARGAALKGLCGIPPRRDIFIRPLLSCTRDEIEEYNRENQIDNIEDETNSQDIYTRNNIRRNIVPLLKGINPRFSENVFNMSDIIRQDEDFMDNQADKFISENVHGGKIEIAALNRLHTAIKTRVIRKIWPSCGKKHIEEIIALTGDKISPSARCNIPGGIARREYGIIVFEKETDNAVWQPFSIKEGEEHKIEPLSIVVKCEKPAPGETGNKTFTTFIFKSENICDKISVRPRISGDSIRLKGGSKTLKKLFIEKKIPAHKRDKIPVVAAGDKVIAVLGIGMDVDFIPDEGQQTLKIEFRVI